MQSVRTSNCESRENLLSPTDGINSTYDIEHCISRGNNKILLMVFLVNMDKKTRRHTALKLGNTLHEDIKMRTENKVLKFVGFFICCLTFTKTGILILFRKQFMNCLCLLDCAFL